MCRWRGELVVNILILLLITLSASVVRCQDATNGEPTEADAMAGSNPASGSGDMKDEPTTSNSGENFVAIHKDAVGAREQLKPTLRGLSHIAISFLPKTYRFVSVLSATREVVAGVRYDLLVEALDEVQAEVVCSMTVLEKPWLTTESGDKYRLLENSNCTSTEQAATDGVEIVTKLNPIFDPNLKSRQDMSPTRFKDLVSQIIIQKHEQQEKITTEAVDVTSTTEQLKVPELSESSKDVLDQLFLFGSESGKQNLSPASPNQRNPEVAEDTIVPKRAEQPQFGVPATESTPETTTLSLDQQVQSTFEEVFKTHREIQKALDEVIQKGGGRDVQLKYEPVFASLLQQVKTSIDNYYQTVNPNGGEANVDTVAFVVSDNVASSRTTFSAGEVNNRSAGSDEDDQQQQIVSPDFQTSLPPRTESPPARELAPPKIDTVVMQFSDSNSNEQQQQQQQQQQVDVQRTRTREELIREFNADESQQRNKRNPESYSHEHDFYHSPFFGSSSHESHEHYGKPYYGIPQFGYNPYYNPHYRGKRFVQMDLDNTDQEQIDDMEKSLTDAIGMLDRMDADPFKRVLLEVVSLKRINQFTSAIQQKGELYVARVVTANSHCLEEAEDVVKCKRLLIDGSSKFCTLEIRVKDKEVQLVKSECSPHKSAGLLGGHKEIDVQSLEHQQRIQAGLKQYKKGKLKFSKFVIRCGSVQVVAGTIHRYTVDLLDSDDNVVSSCKVKIYTPVGEDPEYKFDCLEVSARRVTRDVERKKLSKTPKVGSPSELTPEEYNKPEHSERVRGILLTSNAANVERKYRIVGATQQLVAGNLYTYRLIFNDDPNKRICKLTSHERPWLKEKSPAEAQKVSFSCPDEDAPSKSRTRRSVCAGCPSGLSPEDLKDDEHIERINKILVATGGVAQKKPEILNATAQVVAGMKYTYFIAYTVENTRRVCKLTSWERPWLGESKDAYVYDSSCDGQDETNNVGKSRQKRHVGAARPLSEVKLQSDEHILRINDILLASGGVKQDKPKIINGTTQVVGGVSYTYYISYPVDEGIERVCYLNSWERPWLKNKDQTKNRKYTFRCDGSDENSLKRQRRHAKKVGGSNELSLEDLKDKSHTERIRAGLVAYNEEKSKSYQDFEILKGSVQLVAGSLYKYTFKVKDEPSVLCKISVWERVWLDTVDQRKYNVKCDGDDDPENEQQQAAAKRSTRSIRPHRDQLEHYSRGIDHARHLFEKFKLRHNRTYQSTLEHEMRFRIFKNNLFQIEQLNKYERGTAKYGITHFADMTSTEYKQRTGLVVPNEQERNLIRNPLAKIDENIHLPEAFDWRDLGAVSPVKNQGSCGSCWAFSVIGNIEGLHQIKAKKLEEYSEQELLDCDTVDNACQGGFMDDAYKAIEKLGGLELESEYPYLAKKQKQCHFNKTLAHVRVKGAVDLPKNETAIAQFLVSNGPVSIGLNANAMQFYRGGISHPWRLLCSKKNLDHGVLIVGYGVKEYPMFNKTLPYWIVKNSWGPKWGEQGYYRVYRGDNTCGVSEMASSAVLE
ncbi:uncharacterized protein LOC128733037 isoform X2 [Sabethes cyaneus]|uniref:uncharacterized protein LOC128733037 isoform X2 n=1 Tax=Sabethes cyaneus TaxID=53552 RepID=UPI00237E443C|nr:uncharacterized protein LOC128733037 isoform X2 [Sabethes cyaneus]